MTQSEQSILVVDDTPANLRLMGGILSEYGYSVRPVPDGRLAITAAQSEPPDLILLDIMMPGLSGYEVCEALKADDRTKEIPVIFLSAKSEVEDKVKAFTAGGLDYITKPFQAEEVIARVQTHLKLHRLQQEVETRNRELSETLEQLRAAQDQLIHREKMAALGLLISGVAHEINTPLGAIRASISNVAKAVDASLAELPRIFAELPNDRREDFMALVQRALSLGERLSSREARKARKALQTRLAAEGIPDEGDIANTLVNMGITEAEIDPFLPLLREPDRADLAGAAYHLLMQKNNSKNIEMAVERASRVVTALRRYAHFDESGKKIPAHIPEGIDVVLTLYHNLLKRGVEVITEYEEDLPEIPCFPDELNQVWTNLIHNAIQAMAGKGRLEIRADRRADAIRVQVTDTGAGIPEAIREKVFAPFFTTKPAGEGSGLGLDLVRRIIERHRGEIRFESRPGETTFTVLLPVSPETDPVENAQ